METTRKWLSYGDIVVIIHYLPLMYDFIGIEGTDRTVHQGMNHKPFLPR